MKNKKSNSGIIVILCILLVACIGYIVYDKLNIQKVPNTNINETTTYDLDKAKDLVDKYYLGYGDFANEHVWLAFMQLKAKDVRKESCEQLYKNNNKASRTEGDESDFFRIQDGNLDGFCDETTNVVDYENLNKEYIKLFGKQLDKKDIIGRLKHYPFMLDYDEKTNEFIELNCRCGGISRNNYLYDIISAEVKNNELIIEVGVVEFDSTDNNTYKLFIEKEQQEYTEKEFFVDGFLRTILQKHKDSKEVKKYTFVFNYSNETHNYYLETLK